MTTIIPFPAESRPDLRSFESSDIGQKFYRGPEGIPSNDEIWERGLAALAEMRDTPVEFGYRTTPCTQPLGDETRRAWEAEYNYHRGPKP